MRFYAEQQGQWTQIMVELNRKDLWMLVKAFLRAKVMTYRVHFRHDPEHGLLIGNLELFPQEQNDE